MITVNNLCDFHDLYTSLSVTFTYFNGRNKGIISVIIIYYYYHYYYYYYYYKKKSESFIDKKTNYKIRPIYN